jgi:hypothetical protein
MTLKTATLGIVAVVEANVKNPRLLGNCNEQAIKTMVCPSQSKFCAVGDLVSTAQPRYVHSKNVVR